MPDRVESLREVDRSKNNSGARPGFVKPIRNGLRKKQSLIIKVDHLGRKPAWQRERMELDFRKKSRRDGTMGSKSFQTQEVGGIGWKVAGESRGFPILWMRMIKDVFQMERKECRDQERLKMCSGKFMQKRGKCFSMG